MLEHGLAKRGGNARAWIRGAVLLGEVLLGVWSVKEIKIHKGSNIIRKVIRTTLSRYWANWWLACFIVILPMFLPELVRILPWTSANILPALDSSRKKSNKDCFAIRRTIFSRDLANWWLTSFIVYPRAKWIHLVCRTKYGRFLGQNIIVNVRKITIFSN